MAEQQQSQAPTAASGDVEPSVPQTPWWKRPIVWIVSVVAIGVGAQLQATIQVYVNSALSAVGVTEPGPPIEVLDVHLDLTGAEFALPAGVSDKELATWDRRDMPTIEWLRAHRAVPVDQVSWEITLVGRRTEAVAVTDIKPILEDRRCTGPIGGALIARTPAGGPDGIIDLTAAIDSPDSALKWHDDKGELQPFFTKNNLSLPAGEKNTLAIIATTAGPYCRWTIKVEYLADEGRQTMTITAPGGDPFSVTGKLDPSSYESVFVSPTLNCGKLYTQVSGNEYARILSSNRDPCPNR